MGIAHPAPMQQPRHPGPYLDRHLECQEALESRVIAIIDEGRAAGWSIGDLTTALCALADNLMLADQANAETGRQIAEALARLRGG
jgi:hypothetical protein